MNMLDQFNKKLKRALPPPLKRSTERRQTSNNFLSGQMDVPTCVKFLLDGNFLSFIQNILITHEVKVTISFTKLFWHHLWNHKLPPLEYDIPLSNVRVSWWCKAFNTLDKLNKNLNKSFAPNPNPTPIPYLLSNLLSSVLFCYIPLIKGFNIIVQLFGLFKIARSYSIPQKSVH